MVRPLQSNKGMRFGTWNALSLYRTGTVILVVEEIAKYRRDLVGVHEVRLDGNGISPIGDYLFYYGDGNNNHHLGTVFFYRVDETKRHLNADGRAASAC